ncbi:MAG: glycosyltransferase family 4 protein [Candidatus Hydrogenedentes bacterium]|nr:glycosyltransferase family 4 protein [Candidatus Hydrogenedentota bacterium]
MKVLHLFSNAKWTGPAEPALNLCAALRRAGVEADFACSPDAGDAINKVVETARDRGIEPILSFHLNKHNNPFRNAFDRARLGRYLQTHPYDLIHCHLDNDHRIAAAVARQRGIPLVRSSYYGGGFPEKRRFTRLLAAATHVIQPSHIAAHHDAQVHALETSRQSIVPGAVDVERFDPTREVPDGRRWLNISPDAFVVGIVARLQIHRHYQDFFEAAQKLIAKHPNAHVIVVGRGSREKEVAKDPVRRFALEDRVHFPGYLDGENYVGMLKAFDVKVYLVPGSDGTCRAVRECMAMGKPVVVANRGMLREIIDDGENGVVCDGSAEALFQALDRFAGDRQLVHRMGTAAREKAVTRYSLDVQAAAVKAIYERLLGRPDA